MTLFIRSSFRLSLFVKLRKSFSPFSFQSTAFSFFRSSLSLCMCHLTSPSLPLSPPALPPRLLQYNLHQGFLNSGLSACMAGLPCRSTFGSAAETKLSCLCDEWAFGTITPPPPLIVLVFLLSVVGPSCLPSLLQLIPRALPCPDPV